MPCGGGDSSPELSRSESGANTDDDYPGGGGVRDSGVKPHKKKVANHQEKEKVLNKIKEGNTCN